MVTNQKKNPATQLKTLLQYAKDAQPLKQIGDPTAPAQQGIELLIAKTARRGKSRQISYTKRNGRFNVYDVQRYSFRSYKGTKYFYGWDLKQQTIKSFIVSGISNVATLDTPHKRMWIIQMGNDPQQKRYWQKQKRKTPQQKAADEARRRAKRAGQQVVGQVQPQTTQARQRIQRDVQKTAQPIIKTISRQTRPLRPVRPPLPPGQAAPSRPIKPFGVV